MKRALGIVALVAVVAVFFWLRTEKDRHVSRRASMASEAATPKQAAQPLPDAERFFAEVWPVAKTNLLDKLQALGLVNPLGTNTKPTVTKIRFAGQEGSTVCRAVLNNRVALSYHDLVRGDRRFQGISAFKEVGIDENGVPHDEDAIRLRLNDPRVPDVEKEKLRDAFTDTNLYPRLGQARATEIAQRILQALEERPDLYALNRQRPFESQADGMLAPNYVFIFDRLGQKPTANLAELDRIFIVLRSSKDGVHLQRYDSSYHDFEADAAVHGRR